MTSYEVQASQDAQNRQKTIDALRAWLARQQNWLFILDNADDLEMTSRYVPQLSHTNGMRTRCMRSMPKLVNSNGSLPVAIYSPHQHWSMEYSMLPLLVSMMLPTLVMIRLVILYFLSPLLEFVNDYGNDENDDYLYPTSTFSWHLSH